MRQHRGRFMRRVQCLAFSPDGKTIATGHRGGLVTLWETQSGVKRGELTGHENAVYAVAFAPDGQTLASGGSGGTARLWDLASMRERAVLYVPSDFVLSVAFSPDSRWLFTSDFGHGQGVRRWDVATGEERAKLFDVHGPGGVECMALSPDGKVLASTGHDWGGSVRLWDVSAGKTSGLLESGIAEQRIDITSLAFSPDGKTLVTRGGEDCRLRLWDVGSGNLLRSFGEESDFYHTPSLAFSPDGRIIATAGGSGGGEMSAIVRLWDTATGRTVGRYLGYAKPFTCVAFSPEGKSLAAGSLDENQPVVIFNVDVDHSDLPAERLLTVRATFR
jgi:WD40 repeat protein